MKKASNFTASSRSITSSVAKKQAGNRQAGYLLRWCSNHVGLCFAIASAVWILALYSKALAAPFVYDDLDSIVNDPSLRSWHAMFVRFFLSSVSFSTELFGRGGGSTYRPLYWFTLALDRQFWGINNASGFHLTNLLFHWVNGILLFRLLRRMSIPVLTAAMASIFWLGLPINSEAVAWVSGRAYLLSGFFILLGLLSACSYLNKAKLPTLACYFLLSLGALFSHEQGFLLLPLTVLLIWFTNRNNRGAWISLAGTALAADFIYLAVKYRVGAHSGQGTPALWSIGLEFWKYLGWMIAPVHMSVERSTSLPPNTPSIAAAAAWLALLALIGMAFLLRKKAPVAAAGILCGCMALLPYCGIVYIYQGMAERFLYLASIGFTLSIVSFAIANWKVWKGITVGGLLLWFTWGTWRTMNRVLDWSDPISLYRSSLKATPNSSSLYYNLGFSLRDRGDLNDALYAYRQAIRIQPTYHRAFASIGDIYARLGRPADAVTAYDQSLALQPDDALVTIKSAVASEQLGNDRLAERQFKHAIALDPKDSAVYVDLAALYVQENREDDAIECFQKAIGNNPKDPTAYFDLAVMFQQKGQDQMALAFYKKVLRLKPEDPDTLLYMSKLHVGPPDSR